MLFQVEIPMLLVNAQDDPLIPEELLETPKKYVNSMYECFAKNGTHISNNRSIN